MRRVYLEIILFMALAYCSRSGDVLLSGDDSVEDPLTILTSVDNASPTNIERIRYTVVFSWVDNVEFEVPPVGAEIGGFRIVDVGREGPKRVGAGKELTLWFDLEPDVTGTYILPPVRVKYSYEKQERTAQTTPIFVSVGAHDTAEKQTLIEDPGLVGIRDDRYWFYSLVGFSVLLLIAAIIFALKMYSSRKPVKPPLTPYEKAELGFNDLLRSDFIEKGDSRAFYFSLSEITRRYTDESFSVNTLESTQEEIKQIFRKRKIIIKPWDEKLLSFFERSDFAKFAKRPGTEENMRNDLKMVREYVRVTGSASKEERK